MQPQSADYMLGHAEPELERLIEQSKFFGELSEQLFQLAGIGPGMRVLDLGCGPGDATFLTARLVGPRGAVIGIDASPDAITLAERRARLLGLNNVRFVARDLTQLNASDLGVGVDAANGHFDAVIGRLVLMYLPDPSAVLRRVSALVRPGGIVAFQEFDMAAAHSEPRCELFETCMDRIRAAFAYKRLDLRLGPKQSSIFRRAGLSAPEMRLAGRLEGGPNAAVYEVVAQIIRTLSPVLISAEIASAEDIAIDTLACRLREEALRRDATLASPALVGAWSRVEQAVTGLHKIP